MKVDTKSQPLDVGIVGGGIAGLCLAIGLLNHGVKCTIYESIHAYRQVGAGISFGPNALKAMTLIDPRIKEGVDRIGNKNLWATKQDVVFEFRQGTDSDDWKTFDLVQYARCAAGMTGVLRAGFLHEVLKLVPDGTIQYAKRVMSLEETLGGQTRLNFSDGGHVSHDVVIGCDGIHSIVRKHVLGATNPDVNPHWSGKVCYRGVVDMRKASSILGEEYSKNGTIYLGPAGHLVTFPMRNGELMNVGGFTSRKTWEHDEWVQKTSQKEMTDEYRGWGDKLVQLLGEVESTDMWAVFDLPYGDTFCKGRLAILGDAAHASTPFMGSGSSMAVEDAYILSNLLANVKDAEQIVPALKAYDSVRRPRAQKLVRKSQETCAVIEYESELGADIPRISEDISGRWNWVWHADLEVELEQALAFMRSV